MSSSLISTHVHTQRTATFHTAIASVQKLEWKDSPGLSCLQLQLTMPYVSRYLSSSIFITRLFASKTEMFLNFKSLTVRNSKLLTADAHHCSSWHHCHCWNLPAVHRDKTFPLSDLGPTKSLYSILSLLMIRFLHC